MGADQRDERLRAEETCLIKTKRWNASLMHLLDALCILCSYSTWFLLELPEEGGTGGGVADTRKGRVKEQVWWSFWLFHLLWCGEEFLNAIWVSALYGTTFMKYVLFFLPSFFLSSSNWRCNKGEWGQCFFKVRPLMSLTLMFSSTQMHRWDSICCPSLPGSALLTKATVLKHCFIPLIFFLSIIYG